MKKLLAFILAGIMVVSFVACGEKAPTGVKMQLETRPTYGVDHVIKSEFYYPENSGITEEYNSTDFITLADESEEYLVKFEIAEDDSFETAKNWAKDTYGEDAVKDIKFGEFDAYLYYGMSSYNIVALLEKEASEEGNRYVVIEIETPYYDAAEIEKFVNENEDIRHMLDSFKYLGEAEISEE